MREKAWRVFAGEYNETTLKLDGGGEKNPSYVVTPLGAQINRLYIVGVLTEVESVSSGGEMWRGQVSDPTGVFIVYSGQYQPEITELLTKLDVPSYVAIVGKSRTYEPEDGALYVSVRPEFIKEIDVCLRNYWILETCRHTKRRIDAILEASQMKTPSSRELRNLGFDKELAEGIIKALSHYGQIDVTHYQSLLREALLSLKSGDAKVDSKITEIEERVLYLLSELKANEGVPWDNLVERMIEENFDRGAIEDALGSLMAKGLIYEPILGRLKKT